MPTRKVIAGVVVVAALLFTGGRLTLQPQRTLTLQVTGTRGTHITGEYILAAATHTTREPLDREIPFSIEVSGHVLSATLQKHGGAGTVRMRLLVDGAPVAFNWTKEPYGNVSVATP